MTAYEWVQGDHETVETDLATLDGAPSDLDLTGRTVHYILRHYQGAKVADKQASKSGTTATVELTSENLSRTYSHEAEWVITDGADDPTSLPKDEPIDVDVRPSVDDDDNVAEPLPEDGTVDVLTANGLNGSITGGSLVESLVAANLAIDANDNLFVPDSEVVSALDRQAISPQSTDTEELSVTETYLGRLADTPTDSEIGSGNVALYFKQGNDALYKRPYGGTETAIGGSGESSPWSDSDSDNLYEQDKGGIDVPEVKAGELSVGGGATLSDLLGTNLSQTSGVLEATDTDTTYSAGTGLSLSGETFSTESVPTGDLDQSSATSGQHLAWGGSAWVPVDPPMDTNTQAFSVAASGGPVSLGGAEEVVVDTGHATTNDGHFFGTAEVPDGMDYAVSTHRDASGSGNWKIHVEQNTTAITSGDIDWVLWRGNP